MFTNLPLELNEHIFKYLSIEDLVKYLHLEFVYRIIKKKYNVKYISTIVKYPKLLRYLICIIDKDVALCRSAEQGLVENVKYLIKEGADIRKGWDFSFRYAVKNKHMDVVKLLIKDSYIDALYGEALHSAIDNDDLEMVKYLVKNGCKVHWWEQFYEPVYFENVDIGKFLIEKGAYNISINQSEYEYIYYDKDDPEMGGYLQYIYGNNL